ncbi:MAG: hypothetical protein M3P06_15715 [Acidobacteriota bacterium]|nr:hypothetical protein [Acidobacteriota bacterium]
MATRNEALTTLQQAQVEAAPSSNIGNALTGAGSNFAALLEGVGTAVGATQKHLTETSADTVSELAKTMVEVPAVNETIYGDNGEILSSVTHTQLATALTIFDPVFYDYTQVRLQAEFSISQLATASNSSTSVGISGGGLSLGFSSAFRGGGGFSSSSSSTNVATSTDRVSAIGRVRMFSEMAPTAVIIPSPIQVTIGPSIRILEGELTEVRSGSDVTSRKQQVTIEFVKKDGSTPIPGKILAIDSEGVPWSYDEGNAEDQDDLVVTNDQGRVTLTVERTFPLPSEDAPPPDTTPQPVTLTVRRGQLSNNTVLTL